MEDDSHANIYSILLATSIILMTILLYATSTPILLANIYSILRSYSTLARARVHVRVRAIGDFHCQATTSDYFNA